MNDDLCINTLKRAGFHECAAYIEGILIQLSAAENVSEILKDLAESNGKLAHEAQCRMIEQGKIIESLKDDLNRSLAEGRLRDEPTGTEAEVCKDIAARQAVGLAKYGVSVEENPLDLGQWLQHAYEEALDQAVYLKRATAELKAGDQIRNLDTRDGK